MVPEIKFVVPEIKFVIPETKFGVPELVEGSLCYCKFTWQSSL